MDSAAERKILTPRKRVCPFEGNITENFQVEYWAGKFGVKPVFLREIMTSTGNELAAVQKYFNK